MFKACDSYIEKNPSLILHQNKRSKIAKKYEFKSLEDKENSVQYIWTDDREALVDYFKIRQDSYKEVLGLKNFLGSLDEIDVRSKVCLVMNGQECIGGARHTINDPLLETKLPLEEEDFILEDLFPEYNLQDKHYGEYSRFALKEEYRDGKYAEKLHYMLNKRSIENGLDYVFAVTPLLQARRYQYIYKHVFNLDFIIRDDIEIPLKSIHENLEMRLCVLKL